MKTWWKSLIGGAAGAAAVVVLVWWQGLPGLVSWIAANGSAAVWAGILVNAVGLILIYRQLKLTARAAQSAEAGAAAAKAATEIALAETRPWLKVEIGNPADVSVGPNARWLKAHVRVVVTNVGKTPATHVRFNWDLLTETNDDTLLEKIRAPIGPLLQGSVIFPGESVGFDSFRRIDLPEHAMATAKALLIVRYSSPGGGQHVSPVLAVEPPWDYEPSEGERVVDLCVEVRTPLQPT